MQRVLRRQESFLAVEDRRIGTGPVIVAAGLAGDEIHDDRLFQGGMRVLFKIWIGKKRDLRRGRVEFQQVVFRSDFRALPEFGHRNPEERWDA